MTRSPRSTSAWLLSRAWHRTRPAPAVPRVLYVSNEPVESSHEHTTTALWSDRSIPSLIDFQLVILESPDANTDGVDAVLVEIDVAERCGAQIVLLAGRHSDPAVLARLFALPLIVLRPPAPVRAIECLDASLDAYLELASEAWVLSAVPSESSIRPVAVLGHSGIAVGFESGEFRRTLLPLARDREAAMNALIERSGRHATRRSRQFAPITRVRVACLAFLSVVLMIALGRFFQRDTNLQYAHAPQPTVPYASERFSEFSDTEQLARFIQRAGVQLGPAALTGPSDPAASDADLQQRLRLYASLSLVEKERQVVTALSASGDAVNLTAYLVRTLVPALRRDLRQGRLTSALTRSFMLTDLYYRPRILELAASIGADDEDTEYVGDLEMEVNRAQRIIDFVPRVYLGSQSTGAKEILAFMEDRTQGCAGPSTNDPDVPEDLMAYCVIAGETYRTPDWDARLEAWRGFEAAHPGSSRADEARFNTVRALYYLAHDDPDDSAAREELYAAVSRFAKDYPQSYLLDDASLYAVTLAATQGTAEEFAAASAQFRALPGTGDDKRSSLIAGIRTDLGLENEEWPQPARDAAAALLVRLLRDARSERHANDWARGLSGSEQTVWRERLMPALVKHLNLAEESIADRPLRITADELLRKKVEASQ
ncbi:MAG TPA: hypothetical protein VM032_04885 [Vicinamibacterales bacterium]|nr:hypothetical protein [Vicinamibacterales bacterium]